MRRRPDREERTMAERAKALIFDLDETLVADIRATREALAAASGTEGLRERHGADPEALAQGVWDAAERLWLGSPEVGYTEAIGMASWEGLWARFEGDDAHLRALGAWAPDYRRAAWRQALAARGAPADDALADALQAAFERERRALHLPFPDTRPALDRLRRDYLLALLTNGAPDLQREKVAGAALGDYFAVVVASGDLGAGKPDPRIYRHTLDLLGVAPGEAAMIGDSRRNDVWGPQRVGICGIWLCREDDPDSGARDAEVRPDAVIRTLDEVESAL
jgi:putative hydrolase of the HAD superfamily